MSKDVSCHPFIYTQIFDCQPELFSIYITTLYLTRIDDWLGYFPKIMVAFWLILEQIYELVNLKIIGMVLIDSRLKSSIRTSDD